MNMKTMNSRDFSITIITDDETAVDHAKNNFINAKINRRKKSK
jgi:hypothetical protein